MSEPSLPEESIFAQALELGGADREAFLDQACAEDPALRVGVEALLRANAKTGDMLDLPETDAITNDYRNSGEAPGTLVGPYKLLEQIGEGGFGVVFLAEQTQPVRRKVALKVLKAGMDTMQVVARFEAERQALAVMDHPHIAKVFDGGQTDSGRPYFVMELVRGVPITDFCDQAHLTLQERLDLFVQVCQAAQHAHQKGVIHRDLKPSNVLVCAHDGKPAVKVIDFGIAKATGHQLTDKTLFTNFAQMVGTPLYMSPEQAAQSPDVDTRSDIYSLGVLLYELLTGSTPFTKERFKQAAYDEIRRIIREEEPPRPSTRLSDSKDSLPSISALRHTEPAKLSKLVRGEMDWIVMKALEKDRNRRYETANGFAADVQRYLCGEAVHAVPPSAAYRFRKFARRNRRPVLAAFLVALALVGGIVGTTWGMVRAFHAEAGAVSEAKQKETALEAAQRSEREARDNLWLSLYEQARALRFSHRMGQRTGSLDAVARAAAIRPDERLRDEATVAMALPDIRLGPKWHAWSQDTYGSGFDAQYRSYARISNRGDITIRSLPDNREVRRFDPDPHGFACPNFSPDGKYLSALERGNLQLRIWRMADGNAVLRDELRNVLGVSYNFSPDSRHLVAYQQGSVIRFDLATGRELNRWQLPEKQPAHCLVFHPDNCLLAVGYHSSNIVSVYDVISGKPVATLPLGTTVSAQTVAWHPDGEQLAVSGDDPRIQIWNVTARRKVVTLEGHTPRVNTLSFHPEGRLLASSSWDGTVRIWDPATGRQLIQLGIHDAWPRFSNDGRWLGVVSSGEHAQLLEVIPPREYRSLGTGPTSTPWEHDISPDGQLLALDRVSDVRLFHLPSGRELATLPAGRPLFNSDTELLIAGPGGLHRWPIQPGTAVNELRLGPPRTIALPVAPTRVERGQNGRMLAIIGESNGVGVVVDLTTDSVRALRLPHDKACFIALSRDGRWLATSGWHSSRVRLWNAETGRQVHEWEIYQARVFFSPDSRNLIISQSGEFSFWDVESLRPTQRIHRDAPQYPGHVCFSPNSKLMALEMAPGVLHLRDTATDRTVAKLEDPSSERTGWMSFTPDGTQLVVNAPYGKAVHIWDLRAIRQRLKGMKLDWDWPEFPPAAAGEPGQRLPRPAWNVQIIKPGATGQLSDVKPK